MTVEFGDIARVSSCKSGCKLVGIKLLINLGNFGLSRRSCLDPRSIINLTYSKADGGTPFDWRLSRKSWAENGALREKDSDSSIFQMNSASRISSGFRKSFSISRVNHRSLLQFDVLANAMCISHEEAEFARSRINLQFALNIESKGLLRNCQS